MKKYTQQYEGHERQIEAFLLEIKNKSDKLIDYFLIAFFLGGLLLAYFYDTWNIALGVGGLSLLAYYSTKKLLPNSDLYQYVLSAVLGIFMAQYIYQMHGLFEMHFIAFIGSAILITYQKWELQIPLALVVIIHHATFGYLQYIGYDKIYFTQLPYMSLQTFVIHGFLASTVFYICGLWSYNLKKHTQASIEQTFEMGRLQEEQLQKEALERSNEELKKANKELDRFVYSVSHDLRAPLSSMMGVIGICEAETQDAFLLKNIGMIKKSIGKLDGFIMDILDYSRNSRTEVKKEEIHFNQLLSDISENLKFMGEQKQVELRTKINNGVAFYSDKTRLNIILNNLISNAIRYQNPKSPNPYVEIEVDVSGQQAIVVVRDNGIGIAKENQEKIFEIFYRVSKNSVGSGLGLYIVKESIEKLNGRIEISSEIGIGSEFKIYIPNSPLA